jgi:3-oxoacid CoA-transferase subunit A
MSVYVAGDTHGAIGDYRLTFGSIEYPTEEDYIIICGDNGIFYGDRTNGQCRKFMKKTPVTWILLRGNHDNRILDENNKLRRGWYSSNEFGGETYYQSKYPNIHYVADTGGLYTIGDKNIFMIPGGYSVDKFYRLAHEMSYEPRELLTEDEMHSLWKELMANANKIDYICSHVAPLHIEPYIRDLFLSFIGQDSVDKSMEKWLDAVANYIEGLGTNYKHWYFGHYHADRANIGPHQNFTMLYDRVEKLQ